MNRQQLEAWARPEGILYPEEKGRVREFLALFQEQLALVARNPAEPTVVEVFVTRKRAADLWALDRLTSDGDVLRQRVKDAPTRALGRAEHFAEADLKSRLAHLYFEQLRDAAAFLEHGRNAVVESAEPVESDDNVVTLPAPRRRKGGRR